MTTIRRNRAIVLLVRCTKAKIIRRPSTQHTHLPRNTTFDDIEWCEAEAISSNSLHGRNQFLHYNLPPRRIIIIGWLRARRAPKQCLSTRRFVKYYGIWRKEMWVHKHIEIKVDEIKLSQWRCSFNRLYWIGFSYTHKCACVCVWVFVRHTFRSLRHPVNFDWSDRSKFLFTFNQLLCTYLAGTLTKTKSQSIRPRILYNFVIRICQRSNDVDIARTDSFRINFTSEWY